MQTARRILTVVCIGLVTAQPSLAAPWDDIPSSAGSWLAESDRHRERSALPVWAQAAAAEGTERPGLKIGRTSPGSEVLPPAAWYGANNVHKYLGIGSIALAGLSMISPKEENGPHEFFAKGAAGLGVAAVATGFYAHWDDIDASWRNPDTQHAVLGALGALAILAAVAKGGKEGHAGWGEVGAVSMLIAIKLTW